MSQIVPGVSAKAGQPSRTVERFVKAAGSDSSCRSCRIGSPWRRSITKSTFANAKVQITGADGKARPAKYKRKVVLYTQTQQRLARLFGVDRSTVSLWMDENISNVRIHNANTDARLSVPKAVRAEIRAEAEFVEHVRKISEAGKELMKREPVFEPTPEQIAEACREIQSGWSEDERRRRSGCLQMRAPSEAGRRARSTISEPCEGSSEL